MLELALTRTIYPGFFFKSVDFSFNVRDSFREGGRHFALWLFAVVEEGDEVVLLDPVYETYHSCIILAGGTPVSAATRVLCKLTQLTNKIF